MTVQSLDVVFVRDLAAKFASKRKFVEELEDLVPAFYEHVGEKLQAWVPPPPKIERTDPIDESPIADPPECDLSEDVHPKVPPDEEHR